MFRAYHHVTLLIGTGVLNMKKKESPYESHLFICAKSRGGKRKSCGDIGNPDLKSVLKDAVKDRGWKGRVRVSESSCFGVCEAGPNIMIYPQKIWLSGVSIDDVPEILNTLEECMGK
jgi:(2Fe-2S) ferredoxin